MRHSCSADRKDRRFSGFVVRFKSRLATALTSHDLLEGATASSCQARVKSGHDYYNQIFST